MAHCHQISGCFRQEKKPWSLLNRTLQFQCPFPSVERLWNFAIKRKLEVKQWAMKQHMVGINKLQRVFSEDLRSYSDVHVRIRPQDVIKTNSVRQKEKLDWSYGKNEVLGWSMEEVDFKWCACNQKQKLGKLPIRWEDPFICLHAVRECGKLKIEENGNVVSYIDGMKKRIADSKAAKSIKVNILSWLTLNCHTFKSLVSRSTFFLFPNCTVRSVAHCFKCRWFRIHSRLLA